MEDGPEQTELVVTLPNQPGRLHIMADLLGENGINMRAVACIANGDTADIHAVVSDADAGLKILKDHDYNVKTGKVLLIELEHSPGELARLSRLLAEHKVNITLLYGSGSSSREAQLVVGVDDFEKAKEALSIG